MNFTSKNQRDADAIAAQFHRADITALRAIVVLADRRMKARIALVDHGIDPDQVISDRIDSFRDGFLNRMSPDGTAGKRLGDDVNPFDDEAADIEASEFIPLVKAAIWELWRDYEEWPDEQMLRTRLATWLNVTAANAERVIASVAIDPYLHQTFGYAYPDPNARLKLPDERRWFISDINEAYYQEQLYQWRVLLGEDGVIFRVPFTTFASTVPDAWSIPA